MDENKPLEKYKKREDESGDEKKEIKSSTSEKAQSKTESKEYTGKFYSVLFLTKEEKKLLSNIVSNKDNKSELGIWYGLNFISPVVIILLSFLIAIIATYHDLIHITFKSATSKAGWSLLLGYITDDKFIQVLTKVIFNGSLSLIAINSLLSSSSYIVARGNSDDNTLNAPLLELLYNLRRKLNFQQVVLLIIASTIYIIQIAFVPENYSSMLFLSMIIFSSTLCSINIAKKIYIARENAYMRISPLLDQTTRDSILNIQNQL